MKLRRSLYPRPEIVRGQQGTRGCVARLVQTATPIRLAWSARHPHGRDPVAATRALCCASRRGEQLLQQILCSGWDGLMRIGRLDVIERLLDRPEATKLIEEHEIVLVAFHPGG